ncbi:hypothetical protein [Nonomuraea sp. NPDC002799]
MATVLEPVFFSAHYVLLPVERLTGRRVSGMPTAFGPFQFDRHQYDDALRALNAAIGSDET